MPENVEVPENVPFDRNDADTLRVDVVRASDVFVPGGQASPSCAEMLARNAASSKQDPSAFQSPCTSPPQGSTFPQVVAPLLVSCPSPQPSKTAASSTPGPGLTEGRTTPERGGSARSS
jgi:hypothetical protein